MGPKPPDPAHFQLVTALQRSNRNAFALAALATSTTLVTVAAMFVASSRPIPIVYRSDSVHEAPQVLFAGGESVVPREVDAKQFMVKTGELLHGWSSATVVKDLTAASFLMTPKWRAHFADEVQKVMSVPVEVSPDGKESVLGYYVSLRSKNTLDWNWESLSCERNAVEKSWGCYGRLVVETQPLLGNPLPNAPRVELIVRARFNEVPVTKNTIDGFLVDFWDQRDASAPPAPAGTPPRTP